MYPASSGSKSSARPDTHRGRGAILPAGDGDEARRTRPIRLAGALLALVAPLACAASFLGVEVPPPLPAKNVVDTYWNTPVDDPYRFLENTRETAVQDWMKAQADATEAILAKLPVRAELRKRIAEIDDAVPTVVTSVVRTTSGRWFFMRRNAGENQFKLVRRDSLTGDDVVLVDPDALQKATGKPHAIGGYSASPDGKRVAYSISTGGTEIGSLQVLDATTGTEVEAPIDGIRGGGDVTWLEDGSGFFYTRLRKDWASVAATERFLDNLTYFHPLASTTPDRAVFGPGVDPAVPMPRTASGDLVPVKGTKLVAAVVVDGVKREWSFYVAELAEVLDGKARWKRVFGEEAKIVGAAVGGGWLYVKTSADAPRYKVLRLPLADLDLGRAETVIASGDDVIVEMGAAKDALYVTQRQGPLTRLLRVPHTAAIEPAPVALPFAGHVNLGFTAADQEGAVFELGSWIRSSKFYAFEPASSKVALLPFEPPGKFDAPGGLVAREVRVKGHDGIEVPASIVMRADTRLDGSNPTILYGYGAYGTTEDPGWSPRLLAWLERGGVFVIAHVRGGGVFGDAWHRAGQKTTKPNTWKDGIAVAEWLIAQKYTSPGRLAVMGGSAGGIFVGRAMTARPDLFAAAVISVGNTDLVRSETRANGVANVPEYGTVKQEDEFRALLEMSPYASIRDGVKYPAALFEHGVNDIRVDVWMTLKTASRLSAATASGRPVLLRLEYDGGHGVGGTRTQGQLRTADRWTFLLWQFGIAKPAP
jgi:prolyl oligopeptidase